VREEERQRQRASISRAERVPEARSVRRRFRISNIHGPLIDDNLIGRARRPAPVAVPRRDNPEPRVYPLQITVDAISVPSYRHDARGGIDSNRQHLALRYSPALLPME
jgi:hypothetical protein